MYKGGILKMKKIKKEHGITLVALVITIVVLLILAGISIQAITQNNLFEQAKKAKNATENSQKEENKTLSEYMDKMNEYIPETLASKVNSGEIAIGAYVNYKPEELNEKELQTLKDNLNKYSGVSNDENNTINPAIKRDDLKWRVLDIDETTGGVRLISEKTTNSKIQLYGYDGYNNAVKLIDDACSTLYNNTKFASKVQNLKIADVTRYMTTQPTEDKTEYKPKDIKIPNILKQEENQVVEGSTTHKIGVSEQTEFITGSAQSSTSTLKNILWQQSINANTGFTNKSYYELFIKKDEQYYSYWLSSRCIRARSDDANFYVRFVGSGDVFVDGLCTSGNYERGDYSSFRPVITLKSNIQLDETNPGDGTEGKPFEIK